jgi:hypothetical protein
VTSLLVLLLHHHHHAPRLFIIINLPPLPIHSPFRSDRPFPPEDFEGGLEERKEEGGEGEGEGAAYFLQKANVIDTMLWCFAIVLSIFEVW